MLARTVLLFVSISISLVGFELLLRLHYGPPARFVYPQEQYRHDDQIGHWLEPGQLAHTHDKVVRTNSFGLRAEEYSTAAPVGAKRIIAIGDSQTFGDGLDNRDSWPKQLEHALDRKMKGHVWQVINAGISATDTWQHEIVAHRVLTRYRADMVVVALYINDVTKRYEPRHDARTNTRNKRLGYILKRSAVLSWIRQTYHAFASHGPAERELCVLRGGCDAEDAWAQVASSLRRIQTEARARGVKVALVVLPRRDQIAGTEPGRDYNIRAAQLAGQLEIPAIDLLPELARHYPELGERLFIPWDGHNSATANRLIAEHIADWLAGRL